MQSMMSFVRRNSCAPRIFNSTIRNSATRLVTIGPAGFATMISPAVAQVSDTGSMLQRRFTLQCQLKQNNQMIEAVRRRGAVAHRTTVAGPRGNTASPTQGFWDVCP
jgi:hypothetical protein